MNSENSVRSESLRSAQSGPREDLGKLCCLADQRLFLSFNRKVDLMKAMPITPELRRRIEMQGFVGFSDQTLSEIGLWLRLAPLLCAVWTGIGTYFASPLIIWGLVPFALLGALLPRHPFDLIYNWGIRHLTGSEMIPRYRSPRRFACAIATAWLGLTGWAFYVGASFTGYLLGVVMALMALVTVTMDFCVPSFICGLAFGNKPLCSVSRN